jgi:hypothetical protein
LPQSGFPSRALGKLCVAPFKIAHILGPITEAERQVLVGKQEAAYQADKGAEAEVIPEDGAWAGAEVRLDWTRSVCGEREWETETDGGDGRMK